MTCLRQDIRGPHVEKPESFDDLNPIQMIRDNSTVVSDAVKQARKAFYGR